MGKAARWIVGLVVIAALVVSAWLLLQDGPDKEMTHDAAASVAVAGSAPLAAETAPDLPVPIEAESTKQLPTAPLAAAVPLTPQLDSAAFTGRLVDATGRAVAGAIVHYLPTSRVRTDLGIAFGWSSAPPFDLARLVQARTGSDGRFSLSARDLAPDHAPSAKATGGGPWPGSWNDVPSLLVLHPAFESHVARCTGWRGGAFDAGDIVLAPGVTLSGRAVDEQGRPLAGVTVATPAFDHGPNDARSSEWSVVRATLHTLTGDNGRFAFDGFWAGPRDLELRAPGRCLTQHGFSGEAGRALDLGDIVLPAGGLIEGVVVDTQDRLVPGARVLARPASSMKDMGNSMGDVDHQFRVRMGGVGNSIVDVEGTADQLGAFRLDSLDPARAPFLIYAGASGFEAVRVDDVALGGEPLRVRLAAIASIVLSVVDAESGSPIEGTRVEATRNSDKLHDDNSPLSVASDAVALKAAGVTAAPGVFLLTPAGPLGNSAVVSAPGHGKQSFELPAVPAGERRELTVALARSLGLAGHVLDATRKPIAEAAVELRTIEPEGRGVTIRFPPLVPPPEAQASSAVDGGFTFEDLKPGDWTISAAAAGFTPGKLTVTLQAGAPVADVELLLQPAGAIAGVVLLGGEPVPGARVRAVSVAQAEAVRAAEQAHGGSISLADRPPREEHDAVADAQGRFRFEGLKPEAYELTSYPGALTVAAVKAGETTEVTLQQRAKPRVRGHVSDAHGPVARAEIRWNSYFAPLKGWGSSGEVDAYTDADGNFDLELNAPGHFKIYAEKEHAHAPAVELDADWDQVHWADVKLVDKK